MRRLLKGFARRILVAVAVVVVLTGLALVWMSRSLPAPSGSARVPGLSAAVTITRDRHGVPHIDGASRADVFAGLGFAHAQDRLWQMEVNRMAGQGRLSEMFGKPAVDIDVWLRTMDLYGAARASLKALSPAARAALEAYARGVNAFLALPAQSFAAKLPPEFIILRHRPEPWTTTDTLVTLKMMAVGLSANLDDEIDRLALARAGLSSAEITDLMPPLAADRPPPMPDLNRLLDLPPPAPQAKAAARATPNQVGLADLPWPAGTGASNNWVIAGSRTASGKPILANDPHLGLAAPSIWYLADLRVEKEFGQPRNLTGVTLAGAPFVLLGHGNTFAWGFTNTGADVQDVFVEATDPHDPDRYRTPGGWARFGSKREVIHVKGGVDVDFTRRWSRHGPVLPEAYRSIGALLGPNRQAALSWTALARDDTTAMAGFDMWSFRTVADFQKGMASFVVPMQSMVVADTQGSIGLIAAGRVPVRDPQNAVMGRAPVPGWDARYDWTGTIPFADLPRQTDPPAGAIGTANAKIVGPDYKPFLTFDWEEPYRQRRIDELIVDATGQQTMERSRRAQADVHSDAFAELKPLMLKLVEGRDDVDRGAVSELSAWNAGMAADRPEPLIFMAWVRQAMIDIYADDLGSAFDPWFTIRVGALERALSGHPARDWCDDRTTPNVREDCGTVLSKALREALADLDRRYGPDRSGWTWGKAHVARGRHRPFSEVPVLNRIFDVEIASPGGPFTLDRGVTRVADADDPFGNVSAASYRGLFDLADLSKSTFMQSTGQSGNVFSNHYRDFAGPWVRVEGITIPTDPTRYANPARAWTLTPGAVSGGAQ